MLCLDFFLEGKQMSQIERIKQAIMADPQNTSYTERGIEPLFAAPKTARINIIGQAP